MAIAEMDNVGARVAWLIGARTDDYEFEIDDDRFQKQEIQKAIVETENDLVRDFAEGHHPQRFDFLEWLPDLGLDSGDLIPAHLGQIEAVQIKPYSAGSYAPAYPTTDTNIKLWRDNHNNVFDAIDHNVTGSNLAGYYNITQQSIDFTGYKAQVKIVNYEPDFDYPGGLLQINDYWEGVLTAGAITKLAKIGVPAEIVGHYQRQYDKARMEIRNGLNSAPEIDMSQRDG
jgi:hypothetical protein